jgi:anti-sigma B factor antagonist
VAKPAPEGDVHRDAGFPSCDDDDGEAVVRSRIITGTPTMSEHFRVEEIDGVSVVSLAGPQILSEAGGDLNSLAESGGHEGLLLDFRDVQFLSSKALAMLISLRRKVDAAGGRLRLCGLSPDLLELLRLTQADDLFEVFDARQDGIRGF